MGACEDTRVFEAANEKAALAEARRLMEEARYESGADSYAGHIGICDGVRVYRTAKPMDEEAAIELAFGRFDPKSGLQIENGFAEKWGPALLIRIGETKWLLAGICAS